MQPTTGDRRAEETLQNHALTTPAERRVEAERILESEAQTRKAEFIVEARHLSGNPDLPEAEALAFLAWRNSQQARGLVEAKADLETKPHAKGQL